MLFYRNCINHADYGRSVRTCTSGKRINAGSQPDLLAYAREAGRQAVKLAQTENMRPSDIVTMKSFENAILVHAAISGSTNCLLHIPAIAHEFEWKLQEILLTAFTEMQDIC